MTATTTPDPDAPLPAVLDLVQAAALLGLGRTTAYRLVHDGQWPTPVLRLGRQIKIPTQPLLDLLAGRGPNA
jgi:excisionase family DNA binding protein